jgi:hypothetical protein
MPESAKRVLWRERVLAFDRSGLQRSVWCARHGFKVATLDYWRQQLRHDPEPCTQRLIPIHVNTPAVAVGAIQVDLGGGICLHANASVDANWLALLLGGLRA